MEYKIVEITGGLGNQMFQYAFAKSLEYHLQMPILLDKSWYEANKKQSIPFSLNLYNIDLKYANKEQIDYAKQKVRIFGKEIRIIRSILKRIQGSRIASPCRYDEYRQEYLQPNCFMYFSGYFQNPRYFKGISSHIKKILCPLPIQSEVNKHKLQSILSSQNSVFVHIRRGDYLSLSWQLDVSYYKKAVKLILERVEKPDLFVFCADKAFLQGLDLGYPFIDMTSENINPNNHFEDMTLMAHCKHGIVANSTYSWWSAYLIDNPHKIVIAPTPWVFDTDEIICEDWIKIRATRECQPNKP